MKQPKTIKIDNVEYVRADSVPQKAETKDGMRFVMVRADRAGVHCGYLKFRSGQEVELLDSIRIWYWSGAASLSQLAMEGTNTPESCKFAIPITTSLILTDVIEVIEMTEKARQSIINTPSWRK